MVYFILHYQLHFWHDACLDLLIHTQTRWKMILLVPYCYSYIEIYILIFSIAHSMHTHTRAQMHISHCLPPADR